MRPITPYSLWIGHIGDVNRLEQISHAGIQALVDLADNEKPTLVFRETEIVRREILNAKPRRRIGATNPRVISLRLCALAPLR